MAAHGRARRVTGRTRWLVAAAVLLAAAGAVAVERATTAPPTADDEPSVSTGSADLDRGPSTRPSAAPSPSPAPAPSGLVPEEALPVPGVGGPAMAGGRPFVEQVLGAGSGGSATGDGAAGSASSGGGSGTGAGGQPGGGAGGRPGDGAGAGPRPGGSGQGVGVVVRLRVSPLDGPAHQDVTLRATVAGARGGTVSFWAGRTLLGTAPVRAGAATLTTNVLGAGTHRVVAVHTAPGGTTTSSPAVTVRYGETGDPSGRDDPTGPGGPSDPSDPSGPDGPSGPGGPSDPTDPGPGDPTDPGPGDPSGPDDPHDPDPEPGDGDGSDDPGTPQDPGDPDPRQTILVTVPRGALVLTTPYGPQRPLDLGRAALDPVTATYGASARLEDLVVTDTRAGRPGYTLSVQAGPFVAHGGASFGAEHAGLVDLVATRVPTGSLHPDRIVLRENPPLLPGLSGPRVVATYPAGEAAGATRIEGTFALEGVPSSVPPGRYAATVTFTAL